MRILDSFNCNDCNAMFEAFHSNDNPEERINCTTCNSCNVSKQMTQLNIASSDGNFHSKVPDGFRNLLKEHGKRAGSLSKIDVNSGGI